MNHKFLFTIAKYSVLEAVRDRFLIFILAGVSIILLMSLFAGQLAITEGRVIQASVSGSFLRLFSVFTASLFVITSMLREFNDKGFELILSHPVPRVSYYFGKLIGYSAIVMLIVLMCALCVVGFSSPAAVLAWSFSLFCDLLIIISFMLFCLFSFNSITISFSVVVAFYILARSIEAILLISQSPILALGSDSHRFIQGLLESIAYVIPDFDAFTRSDWLVYAIPGKEELFLIAGQTLIYIILLAAAALFDLYRKEL